MNNDVEFINLRDEFCRRLEPAVLSADRKCWEFYINSTAENLKTYEAAQDAVYRLYQNSNLYKNFQKFKNLSDRHLNKHLKRLLREFEEELNTGGIKRELRNKENEIAAKFNAYIPMIDGKEISKIEIGILLQTNKNEELRKKAYNAKVICGAIISNDMVEFVKLRNEFAVSKGYRTFFEYSLKEIYEVEPNQLAELIGTIYKTAAAEIKKLQKENKYELAQEFKIKESELRAYHYGLLSENNPIREINKYLKTKEQVVEISKNAYLDMGYDIDKMPIIMDLFPRKNKNTHGFCFDIEAGKDARILANLTNDFSSINTLCHELGHCIYHLGVDSTLPYFDREEYPAVTEGIAMMMGDLQQLENILKNTVPDEIIENHRAEYKKSEVKFITKSILIIRFEQELYENPDQDLGKLWHDLKCKYTGANEAEEINNEWAVIPHYLSHPGYYQNYFRANLIKAQIYGFLKNKYGLLTENKNTAQILGNNLFRFGTSLEENELIESLTGEPPASRAFCKNLE